MRVLVTGATGLVGGAAADALKARGHAVIGLARSDRAERKLGERGFGVARGDIADPRSLRVAAQDVDAVVHAAMADDGRVSEHDEAATDAFLDVLAGSGKRFVYTSGTLLYGNTPQGALATEDWPFDPPALAAWRATLDPKVQAARDHGVHSIVVRPAWVYGRSGGPAMMFFGMAKQGGAARHVGDGRNRWTTVHADDLGELYALAVEGAPAGSVYNGAAGEPVRAREIASAASAAAGSGGKVEAWPIDEARRALGVFADAHLVDQAVSGERARRDLGWRPTRRTIITEFASQAGPAPA